jgi:hypothetical protein
MVYNTVVIEGSTLKPHQVCQLMQMFEESSDKKQRQELLDSGLLGSEPERLEVEGMVAALERISAHTTTGTHDIDLEVGITYGDEIIIREYFGKFGNLQKWYELQYLICITVCAAVAS